VWQRCTQGVNGALNPLTQPYRPDRGTASLITLGSHRDLTREAVEAVAWGGERLALAPAALERVATGQAELLAPLPGRPGGTRYATRMTRMPETYLDAASTTPLHPQARAALLEVLPAAVAELREMADLDSQALDRAARPEGSGEPQGGAPVGRDRR